jgi:hypothetical protein
MDDRSAEEVSKVLEESNITDEGRKNLKKAIQYA